MTVQAHFLVNKLVTGQDKLFLTVHGGSWLFMGTTGHVQPRTALYSPFPCGMTSRVMALSSVA